MNKKTEAEFQRIAEEAIRGADFVICSFEDFVEGLELMWREIRDRWHDAEEELEERESE